MVAPGPHRDRPSVAHGAPLGRPTRQATCMPAHRTADVVVIGAGISGLSAARELHRVGREVVVLEKSRGFGGRAASRTLHGVRFDHGAQFVTVRDPRFAQQVDAWVSEGTMTAWTHGVERWTAAEGWRHPSPGAHPRYACPDGMNALGKSLARGLRVERSALVRNVRPDGGPWLVELEGAEAWRARRVVISAPVPQALALLDEASIPRQLRHELTGLTYAPCHAVVAHYGDQTPPRWEGVQLPEHPELAWIANDTSRRRVAARDGATLVLHATASASRARFDDDAEAVTRRLLDAASALVPWAREPSWTMHHRWRYALADRTWPTPALVAAPGLVLCGDAFGDGRLEGAYVSGLEAAAR
jgi:renalase